MHIGVNALFQADGGSLKNLRQLLSEWNRLSLLDGHRLTIFCSRKTYHGIRSVLGKPHRVIVWDACDRGLMARTWMEQVRLPQALRLLKVDVLFCPGNTIPISTKVPSVVTFQNAAPFCATNTLSALGVAAWLRFLLLQFFILISAVRASRIVYISKYFRTIIEGRYRIASMKGTLIYRARKEFSRRTACGALRKHYQLRHPMVLCVSHIYPYKNVLELVQAHLKFVAGSGIDAQLVVAGGKSIFKSEDQLRSLLLSAAVGSTSVNLIGEVPAEHVEQLLLEADLFAFPSTCENCPTALIEALSAGLPIVCSNSGVMPEIAGDAAVYFDPGNIEDIASALARVIGNRVVRREMRKRSKARSKKFPTTEEMAMKTFSAIIEATGCFTK